jgi:surfeit locus 1 family protein
MKRIPIVATLVVLAAVALMIALGVWQLHRLSWKEGLIARYQAAMNQPVLDWHDGVPLGAKGDYRRVRLICTRFDDEKLVGGRNASGQSGWAHWVTCSAPSGSVTVVAGWSRDLTPRALSPAIVTGHALGATMARTCASSPIRRLEGWRPMPPIRGICRTITSPMRCSGSFRGDGSGDLRDRGVEEGEEGLSRGRYAPAPRYVFR